MRLNKANRFSFSKLFPHFSRNNNDSLKDFKNVIKNE